MDKIDNLLAQIATLEELNENLTNNFGAYENEIEELKNSIKKLEEELEVANNSQCESEKAKLEKEIQNINDKYAQEIYDLDIAKNQLEEELRNLKTSNDNCIEQENKIQQLEKVIKDTNNALNEVKAERADLMRKWNKMPWICRKAA